MTKPRRWHGPAASFFPSRLLRLVRGFCAPRARCSKAGRALAQYLNYKSKQYRRTALDWLMPIIEPKAGAVAAHIWKILRKTDCDE